MNPFSTVSPVHLQTHCSLLVAVVLAAVCALELSAQRAGASAPSAHDHVACGLVLTFLSEYYWLMIS